ncbi:hypothetical protein D3C86_1475280 [compost metagenome]
MYTTIQVALHLITKDVGEGFVKCAGFVLIHKTGSILRYGMCKFMTHNVFSGQVVRTVFTKYQPFIGRAPVRILYTGSTHNLHFGIAVIVAATVQDVFVIVPGLRSYPVRGSLLGTIRSPDIISVKRVFGTVADRTVVSAKVFIVPFLSPDSRTAIIAAQHMVAV